MAGKIIQMSKIKQLLRLYQSGCSKREIAKILKMSKNTVKAIFIGQYQSKYIIRLNCTPKPDESEQLFFYD